MNEKADRQGDAGQPSWLAALTDPAKQEGRLKPRTLRILWILGLVLVVGIGLMNVAEIFRPQPYGGSTAGGLTSGSTGSSSAGSGLSGTGGTSASGGTAGAPGLWLRVGDLEEMVERDLVRILSKIAGAGEVSVAVSFETGATYVYGYDVVQTDQTTRESDSAGGTREVSQTSSTRTVVVVPQGSGSQPVVVKVEWPPIQGVVVVASGATDSRVKALLSQAVQILYGVPAHKVVVLPGG